MTYHSDHHNGPADVAYRPAGTGLVIRAYCMTCHKHRLQAGGQGKPGPRWRCAVCVQAKAGGAAG